MIASRLFSFLVPFVYVTNIHGYTSAIYTGRIFQYHFYIASIVLAFTLALHSTHAFTKHSKELYRYVLGCILFLLLCGLSLLLVKNDTQALDQFSRYFSTIALSCSFAMVVQSRERLFKDACFGVFIAVSLLCIVSFMEFFDPTFRVFASASNNVEEQFISGEASRIGGLHVNPNENGNAMILGMFVALLAVPKVLRLAFLLAVGLAVITTASRSSLLMWPLVFFLAFQIGLCGKKTIVKFFIVTAIIILIGTLLISGNIPLYLEYIGLDQYLSENMKERLSGNFFTQEDDSTDSRIELALEGLVGFTDNPILGGGLGTSSPTDSQGTHNMPVKLGYELGILSLLLIFIGFPFLAIQNKSLFGGVFLLLVFVNSFFTHNMYEHAYLPILLVTSVVLAPIFSISKRKTRRKRVRKRKSSSLQSRRDSNRRKQRTDRL